MQDLAPSACSEKVSSPVEHPQQWETSTSVAVIYTLLRRSPRLTLKCRSSAPAGSNQGHRNNPLPPHIRPPPLGSRCYNRHTDTTSSTGSCTKVVFYRKAFIGLFLPDLGAEGVEVESRLVVFVFAAC